MPGGVERIVERAAALWTRLNGHAQSQRTVEDGRAPGQYRLNNRADRRFRAGGNRDERKGGWHADCPALRARLVTAAVVRDRGGVGAGRRGPRRGAAAAIMMGL